MTQKHYFEKKENCRSFFAQYNQKTYRSEMISFRCRQRSSQKKNEDDKNFSKTLKQNTNNKVFKVLTLSSVYRILENQHLLTINIKILMIIKK